MEMPQGTQNERMTIRLQKTLVDSLKKQAEEQDLPINSIISRILIQHFSEKRVDVLPSISVSHILFENMLRGIDDPKLEKIATSGKLITKKYFDLINENHEFENVVKNYFTILGKYCGWFIFHQEKNGSVHKLIFESELGDNWSRFLRTYIKSILEKCKVKIISESCENDVIIFEVIKI